MTRHVALVGFMASGKTTIGKYLAREIGAPFIDTDDLVVARHGPIAAIFERHGEAGFRAAEFEAVRDALGGPPAVLALGGGAVTNPLTYALLVARSLRVYLDVPAETILTRLHRSNTERPLAGRQPADAEVRALLAAREPLYRSSDLIVPGPHKTKRGYAVEIAERIRETAAMTGVRRVEALAE